MIEWQKYFDHVFCVHYSGYRDRVPRMVDQLKRVGLYQSDIFSFHNTISSVFINRLMTVSNLNPAYNEYWTKPGFFNCQFNHYWILRESLLAGYKRILVLEDDVVFLKDIKLFNEIISNSPKDADLILYDYWSYFKKDQNEPGLFSRIRNTGEIYHSSSMYSMNEKYMQAYASFFDMTMVSFDDLWNRLDKCQNICYRANIHAGIQKAYECSLTLADDTEKLYLKMGVDVNEYC